MNTLTPIKSRPILFSAPMVNAILNGSKTQTRRIVKPQPSTEATHFNFNPTSWPKSPWCARFRIDTEIEQYEITDGYKCPYGKVGDRLWVRETWVETTNINRLDPWPNRPHMINDADEDYVMSAYIYRADGEWQWCDEDGSSTERSYWKPSIFMPRPVSRILLEITDIRVERLQDISDEDAVAEGILATDKAYKIGSAYFDYSGTLGAQGYNYNSPIASFKTLWQSINGEDSWNDNPWVWVVDFKKVETL